METLECRYWGFCWTTVRELWSHYQNRQWLDWLCLLLVTRYWMWPDQRRQLEQRERERDRQIKTMKKRYCLRWLWNAAIDVVICHSLRAKRFNEYIFTQARIKHTHIGAVCRGVTVNLLRRRERINLQLIVLVITLSGFSWCQGKGQGCLVQSDLHEGILHWPRLRSS